MLRILREAGAGEGGGAPDVTDWRTALPEDIRSNAAFEKITANNHAEAIAEMGRLTIAAEATIGADKVVIPGRDATDDQRREFFTTLGCPQEVSGYEMPTDLPEGVTVTDEQQKAFFKEAHEMGINKQQAARLIRYQTTLIATEMKVHADAQVETRAASEATLRKEWGPAYDERMEMARNAIRHFGSDGLMEVLNAPGGIGNNPDLARAFANMGKLMKEDEILGSGAHGRFKMTPAEAQQEIVVKGRDTGFQKAYRDNQHPEHAQTVAEMARLHEIAYPAAAPETITAPTAPTTPTAPAAP